VDDRDREPGEPGRLARYYLGRLQTVQALEIVLKGLANRDLVAVTVS
jgi:hypothetical protein